MVAIFVLAESVFDFARNAIVSLKIHKILHEVEVTRARNNKLWMGLLRIALESRPTEAKSLLGEINTNDQKISKLLGMLSDE